MQEINTVLFQKLNELSSNDFIALLAPLLADIPIFFLPIFLVGMWVYYCYFYKKSSSSEERKIALMHIFYGSCIAIIISLIIQQFVSIDRPETAITGASKLLLDHIPDASFPSDHTSVGVAFLFGLFFLGYKKVFWSFLPWIVLMCISRVIAGVHWPFDIIAGVMIGILSAYIALRLTQNKFVKSWNLLIIKLLSYIKL